IHDDDELVSTRRVDAGDRVLIVSRNGMAVRFEEGQARPMGRDTSGVRGMDVSGEGDAVLVMDVARDDMELLVVTENGYGKRTPISEYRLTRRGAKGVGTIKAVEARGELAGALVVRPHQELVFISGQGMVQRTRAGEIRQTGRLTQGVRIMNMRDDDTVSAVAVVVEEQAADAAVDSAQEGDGPVDIPSG
ncbi:MAG: DNA gyrase subunit A, partial [Solirubrobacterales bacterium]|nr:DNA gyrase subunit A [Solirubrobacterales bacterium]